MEQTTTQLVVRPLAVAAGFLIATALLLSAAQVGSPSVSGYGVDYKPNILVSAVGE